MYFLLMFWIVSPVLVERMTTPANAVVGSNCTAARLLHRASTGRGRKRKADGSTPSQQVKQGQTMKAIRVAKFGGPQVLKFVDGLDIPACNADEVLIRVHAVGVNPVETYIREGNFRRIPTLPYTPGNDCAGEIVSLGAMVHGSGQLKVGQRVYTTWSTTGAYASHCTAPANHVHPLSDKLTYEQGAALGVPYYTAYRALFIRGRGKAGETVLIHGATGAVGIACTQLASSRGLKVLATGGTDEGLQAVTKSGAVAVFNHREKDYVKKIQAAAPNGIDLIVEMLANKNLTTDCELAAPHGRVMVVGCRSQHNFDPRLTMGSELDVLGVALYTGSPNDWTESAKAIGDLIEAGKVSPVIARSYPLTEASQAHVDIIENQGARGKLVLAID